MTQSRRSFMKKAGLGFLYLTTACTKADIYVGEFDFDDEDISSNPSNPSDPSDPSNPANPVNPANPSYRYSLRYKSWEEIYTQEVYNHYDAQFKNADDYTHKIYIDPTYQGGSSDGTIEQPFTSLLDVPNQSDTAYLIKRGTEHDISGEGYWKGLSRGDLMLGAYGEGEKPKLLGDRTLEMVGDRNLVRDIQFARIRMGKYGDPYSDDSIIFNCISDGSAQIVIWGRNNKIIGCEIKNKRVNGLFIQQGDLTRDSNTEVAYCYIHHVNQLWHGNGTPGGRIGQTPAGGDPIHIASRFRGHFWIHHNILDRSDTGNKFCFIVNTVEPAPVSGVFEYNHCLGPMSDPDSGNILYIDGHKDTPFDSIIVRNNIMVGTYDPYSDKWTSRGIFVQYAKVEVYGNLIKDVTIGITRHHNAGGDSYFYNNTLIDVRESPDISAVLAGVHNNIFSQSSIRISGDHVRGNNIFLNDPSTLPENVFVDPASEDYRLKENSPAINAGTWENYMDNNWNSDSLGNHVPQNNQINIGCFQ